VSEEVRTGIESTLIDRRKLLLGLAMGAAAGLTFARQPRNRIDLLGDQKLENIVPKQIGDWSFLSNSGLVLPTEDSLSAALYSQLLTRVYVHPTAPPVMLLIAQSNGQSGFLQIHRPEFCYPAGGFTLSPIVQRPIAGGERTFEVNELTATLPGRPEQIIYWTRIGNDMPASWAKQRMAVAEANLRGYIPDAALIRVSMVSPDAEASFAGLSAFIKDMLAAMGPKRSVLVAGA
jgi:EpsI family protein